MWYHYYDFLIMTSSAAVPTHGALSQRLGPPAGALVLLLYVLSPATSLPRQCHPHHVCSDYVAASQVQDVVSANLLHGFGQFNLRTLPTSAFAALPALVEARAFGDRAACATRSARARAQRRPTGSRAPRHIVGVLTRRAR